MQAHFKLLFNRTTRRLSFPDLPGWAALASRIEQVYSIPFDKVAVSYVDIDGDEITLNSQEELEDYYLVTHKIGQSIRFVVQDLGAPRQQDKALPKTPGDSLRNTFGTSHPFDSDDDDAGEEEEWQRLPNIFMAPVANVRLEPTQAFIETVDSEVNSPKPADQYDDDSSSDSSEDLVDLAPQEDKGKGKAREAQTNDQESVSSTGSVIANDTPTRKFPVHVYDRSGDFQRTASPFFTGPAGKPTSTAPSTAQDVPAESTPRKAPAVQTQADNNTVANQSEIAPDPPLPNIESPSVDIPSISNDLANLLTTLTNVFTTHPELADGLKTISANAVNGRYWAAHREAISRAADEISRATRDSGAAAYQEAEAGKRVAEALGGIFKSFAAPRGFPGEAVAREYPQNPSPLAPHAAAAPPPRDLRAEVEQAKEAYKIAKERYRLDRDARRQEKEDRHRLLRLIATAPANALPTVLPAAVPTVPAAPTGPPPVPHQATPEVHLVSNARGGYPELEMFSLGANKGTSHPPAPTRQQGPDQVTDALFVRSVHRILKRLADMGFTEAAHPNLPARVKSMLPPVGSANKDAEDRVVTTILESLLDNAGSKHPAASGSSALPGGRQ